MMQRRTTFAVLIATNIAALLLVTWQGLRACGPDFEPTTFVGRKSPDDVAAFARGRLGLLQARFDSSDYAVAFRYLSGGSLSAAEQTIYAPPSTVMPDLRNLTPEQVAAVQKADREATTHASGPGTWLLERAKYAPTLAPNTPEPSFPTDYLGNAYDPSYLNCPDAAFRNAALTLRARAAVWGAKSPSVAEWIRGQDAVFQECAASSAAMPAAVPPNSPALLRADRTYQIAASKFYAKQFDAAAQDFQAIARDQASPWNTWGEYLSARALVRKAFALGAKTEPYSDDLASFDLNTMQQAQQKLELALRQTHPGPSRSALEQELNFVRLRTEPDKRLTEICAALAGPAPDANFSNDLADLQFVLIKRIKFSDPPPLLQWIMAWRGPNDGEVARSVWKQTSGLPWLVLAIAQTNPDDASAPQLLAAASAIKPATPAYDTIFFQRVRLLIGSHHGEEARDLLDKALPGLIRDKPSSNTNALLGQRMAVARNFNEFLEYAPRTSLRSSHFGDSQAAQEPGFDTDSVSVMNQRSPLEVWVQAANSSTLPLNLRGYVVLAAWTRSVALEDNVSAAKLTPLLPEALRKTVGEGFGFAADVAILRNPGLRPYLESGTSRLANFGELDTYRDNWWNARWEGRYQSASPQLDAPDYQAFLGKEQISQGEEEARRLMQFPAGPVLIGRRVVQYARAHPDDANVPPALALTVRATRYGAQNWDAQGTSADNSAVSKAAFELLHSRYPQSPWTAKTPYHY